MKKLLIIFTICLLEFTTNAEPNLGLSDFVASTEPVSKSRAELKKKVTKLAEKCAPIVGGTVDLLYNNSTKTKQGECLNACVMKDLHMARRNGTFDIPEVLAYVKQYTNGDRSLFKKIMYIFYNCNGKKRSKQCDKADAEYKVCLKKNDKTAT